MANIYLSNLKPDLPDSRDYIFKANTFNLPQKVDLRAHSREIEDQGSLGSCTANAAVSVLENVFARAGVTINLSRLFLYWVTRNYTDETRNQDIGAYSRDVFKALIEFGVCEEDVYPYTESLVNVQPEQTIYDSAVNNVVLLRYERIARQDDAKFYKQMKAALAKGYPVFIGMTLRQPFFGVPRGSSMSQHKTYFYLRDYRNAEVVGGHAMCVVGYDDDAGHWIVENSWGPDWADNGFVGIPYGLLDVDFHDIWVMTGFARKGQEQAVQELWVEPEPVPFEGVASDSDVYYVFRKTPTEQISFTTGMKFNAIGGAAPYTYASGALFFKWLNADTNTPTLSYDWSGNLFRPNGGDYVEESSITNHHITDSSFRPQTKAKQLRLVAVDFKRVDDLPATFNSESMILELPSIVVVNGLRFTDVRVKILHTGDVVANDPTVSTTVPIVDMTNPLRIRLEVPKVVVNGVLIYNVSLTGFSYEVV